VRRAVRKSVSLVTCPGGLRDKHPEQDGALSPEDVAAHVGEIADPTGFSEPPDWPAEWQLVVERFRARGAGP